MTITEMNRAFLALKDAGQEVLELGEHAALCRAKRFGSTGPWGVYRLHKGVPEGGETYATRLEAREAYIAQMRMDGTEAEEAEKWDEVLYSVDAEEKANQHTEKISTRLRQLMAEYGITIPELSVETGISVNTIKNYIYKNQEPRSKSMSALKRYFGVSGTYLRGETDIDCTVRPKHVSFRERREALGLSQSELAERIGVDQTAISQWERGVNLPRLSKCARIAKILGCTISDFLDAESEDFPTAN